MRGRWAFGAGDDGFTLVELVVGVTLMVTVVLGLARATDSGLRGVKEIADRSAFTNHGAAELEEARAASYDSLAIDTTTTNVPRSATVPVAYTVTQTISWLSGSSGVKKIEVTVTWQEGASSRHVTTSTLRYPGGTGPTTANQSPTAAIVTDKTSGSTPLTVAFSSTGSSDPDGTIVAYEWRFGDGTTATTPTASHQYTANGTYAAVLKVTDDDGATAVASRTITVGTNQPPNAVVMTDRTSGHASLAVAFDGTGSTDPEGSALTYSWVFGDGGSGTGATISHTYTTAGTFTAVLTVRDSGGVTDTASMTITVTTNSAPVAAMTVIENGLTVTVDAGGSTDADGDPLTYTWVWGDGTANSTGVTATHTYTAANMNLSSITLTVGDGLATGTATSTPCLISAASFTSNSLTNVITVKNNNNRYADKAIVFRGTSNRYCTAMSVSLPSATGTYTYTFANQTTGTTTTWTSPNQTPAQTYTWTLSATNNYTATMTGTGGTVRTYGFRAQ